MNNPKTKTVIHWASFFIESTTELLVMYIAPLTGLLYKNLNNIICAACYSTIASQPNIWKYCWAINTHNRKSPEPYPIYREKLCLPIFPYKNILNSLLIVSNFFCMTALSFFVFIKVMLTNNQRKCELQRCYCTCVISNIIIAKHKKSPIFGYSCLYRAEFCNSVNIKGYSTTTQQVALH